MQILTDVLTTYAYFWGSCGALAIFLLIYHAREDLRRRMLRMGVAVGIVGIFSEAVFFRDYWHPPLLIRFGHFGGIEDFIFGVAFGGTCVALYDVVFHKRLKRKDYPHYWITTVLIVSELLTVGLLAGRINSIYASALGFVLPALISILMRHDLILETLFSAFLGGSILILMEMTALVLVPGYLEEHFLLYGQVPLLFGVVPVTEFMWGAAFAAIVGPLRDFEFGYVPVSIQASRKNKK